MLDYLCRYGETPFEKYPLCDADRLVFSQMVYMNLRAAQPGEMLPKALDSAKWSPVNASEVRFGFQNRNDMKLCRAASCAGRYAGIRFINFTNKYDAVREQQFAAMTLEMPGGARFIVYRGTDNSLAGWKEDFNLAYRQDIPSHALALEYASGMAGENSFELMGHSKGGHLALYAAACIDAAVRKRLVRATSFDGPGFSDEVLAGAGFEEAKDRMRVIMPRSSIVGLLFKQPVEREFVDSRLISAMQHYPYHWVIEDGQFISCADKTVSARIIGKTLERMLTMLSVDERRVLVESVYRIIMSTNAETLNDMVGSWITNTGPIVRALFSQNREAYAVFTKTIMAFWRSAAQALGVSEEADE